MLNQVHNGDCIEVMRTLPDCSVDAVVSDPPYELGFMGKAWDASGIAYQADTWREALRVLKPGGYLLAFGGSRTYHRMACAVEDAGFEIRDQIMWIYGSGFPKSLDVSKAIDKAAGAEREVVGASLYADKGRAKAEGWGMGDSATEQVTAPATPDAIRWQGWGTALKPAHEPIVMARKPFPGTVAANVLEHGTGAVNIDGCRIGSTVETWPASRSYGTKAKKFNSYEETESHTQPTGEAPAGRWPANIILDDEAGRLLDAQSGVSSSTNAPRHNNDYKSVSKGAETAHTTYGHNDTGGASRFFFNARFTADELLLRRATGIIDVWKPNIVSIAELSSDQQSQAVASVLSDAVTLVSHGETRLSDLQGLTTSVTPSELRMLLEAVIMLTLSTEPKSLPVSQEIGRIQYSNPARSAETNEPTDTTTITASPKKSDGCAVAVTLSTMQPSSEAGVVASRFRYSAKASRGERNAGLEGMPERANMWCGQGVGLAIRCQQCSECGRKHPNSAESCTCGGSLESAAVANPPRANHHPTVKPLALMRYLCRLVTPPGGVILDPFAGSGSTCCAAVLEGFQYIGIDQDAEYCEIARRRIAHWSKQQRGLFTAPV